MILFPLWRNSDHVDSLSVQDSPEQIHAGRAVVVPADHHNLSIRNCLPEPGDEVIKYLHCFCRWHRLVIDISGDQNGVRLLGLRLFNNLPENKPLIFTEIPIDQLQTDMKIR